MPTNWFYAYEGQPHGPFSAEEIKALVATGLLGAQEPVWPEGKDAGAAVPAESLGGSAEQPERQAGAASAAAAPAGSGMPDWLGDVASLESAQAASPREQAAEPHEAEGMDWLEDLRIWVGLDVHETKRRPPGSVPIARPISAHHAGVSRHDSLPADTVPIAMPVPDPAAEAEVPVGEIEAPVRVVDTLAQQTLAETGFDFKTGRVVNVAKFKKWKQQKARSPDAGPGTMTNASQLELFRQARTAIENWVEDEKNRVRILEKTVEQIKANGKIQEIYRQYAGFGFRQKLETYLEFLVKNRKRLYEAQERTARKTV